MVNEVLKHLLIVDYIGRWESVMIFRSVKYLFLECQTRFETGAALVNREK